MIKNNKLLKATLITIFIAPSLLAQTISEKGIATVELTGRACSGGSPTDKKVQLKAVEMAKLSAWNKYTSQLSGFPIKLNESEDSFLNTNKHTTDYVILTSNCSKTDKSYSLTIRANINEARVNNKLVTQSGDSQAKANLQGQGIVVLVVPRQTTEALSFDAKITKQAMSKKSLSADEAVLDNGSEVSITESSTERASFTTGGSTSKKATKRTYTIGDLNDASAQINNVLSPLGMRTFSAARLEGLAGRQGYEPFLKEVLDQFSGKSGDLGANISPQTQESIINMILDVGQGRLNYFVLGTVDSSVPRVDPDTGTFKADVLVNIQLFKIDDFFGAEIVAAVGPEIKTAFGETDATTGEWQINTSPSVHTLILKL